MKTGRSLRELFSFPGFVALMNGLLHARPDSAGLPRAGIVHRLDKDTSGLMVVARDRATMDALVRMIAAREVSRQYLALAWGAWRHAPHRRVSAAVPIRSPIFGIARSCRCSRPHPASGRSACSTR